MIELSPAVLLLLVVLLGVALPDAAAPPQEKTPAALNFKMKRLDGKDIDLGQFKGKVVLFVNVASECGLTPQYKGLQTLHKQYADKGLVIIGVPSNDFGKQEPGSNDEIVQFCKQNYGVEFVMLGKAVVKGAGQCPLYQYLTAKETNPKFSGPIRWNFDKFLIGRNGEIIARFAPDVEPEAADIVNAIRKELGE